MRLSIRAEQMSVVEAVTQENFVRRITSHLLDEYPDSVVILPSNEKLTVQELPEETFNDLVRTGINRARSYEMTFESSIATFTTLMFAVSPNFDKHTLFQVIFNDEGVEPNNQLDEISNMFTDKNWDSIREKYDPKAWNLEASSDDVNETQEKDESQLNPLEPKNEDLDDQDFEQTIKIPN